MAVERSALLIAPPENAIRITQQWNGLKIGELLAPLLQKLDQAVVHSHENSPYIGIQRPPESLQWVFGRLR